MARLPLRQPTPQLQVRMACYRPGDRPSAPARLRCCSPQGGSQTTARSQFTANPMHLQSWLPQWGVCHVRNRRGQELEALDQADVPHSRRRRRRQRWRAVLRPLRAVERPVRACRLGVALLGIELHPRAERLA
eukprot:2075828-Alexandrium_andersonii.AAC.1